MSASFKKFILSSFFEEGKTNSLRINSFFPSRFLLLFLVQYASFLLTFLFFSPDFKSPLIVRISEILFRLFKRSEEANVWAEVAVAALPHHITANAYCEKVGGVRGGGRVIHCASPKEWVWA